MEPNTFFRIAALLSTLFNRIIITEERGRRRPGCVYASCSSCSAANTCLLNRDLVGCLELLELNARTHI